MVPDIFGIIQGDGLEKLDIIRRSPCIRCTKAESVSISAKLALDLGRVFQGWRGPQRDICRIDPQVFELILFYEFKSIFLPGDFRRIGLGRIHVLE